MVRGMNNIEPRSEALALVDCVSEPTDSVCQRPQNVPILMQTMNLAGAAKNTKWHLALNLHVERLRRIIEIGKEKGIEKKKRRETTTMKQMQ